MYQVKKGPWDERLFCWWLNIKKDDVASWEIADISKVNEWATNPWPGYLWLPSSCFIPLGSVLPQFLWIILGLYLFITISWLIYSIYWGGHIALTMSPTVSINLIFIKQGPLQIETLKMYPLQSLYESKQPTWARVKMLLLIVHWKPEYC